MIMMKNLGAGTLALHCSLSAQTTNTDLPRLYDGKPDLNGVWDIHF